MREIQSRHAKLRGEIEQSKEQFRFNMAMARKDHKRVLFCLVILFLTLTGLALWLLTQIDWLVVGEALGTFLGAIQTGMRLKGQ